MSHSSSIHVSHLPLVLMADRGVNGVLVGHMARANQHWKDFDGEREALCIFHGPHSYISPSWYRTQSAVPTWNYAVVHAQRRPKLLEGEAVAQAIERMIRQFDPALASRSHPWDPSWTTLLDHIVAFEMEIESLVGKYKLGQNRSPEDQQGIVDGLAAREDDEARGLLAFMRERGLRT